MTPIKFLPAILLCLLPLVAQAETPEEKGLAIAVEADNRDTGFVDYTNNVQMILRNKHGQESTRVIRSKTLEVDGDGDKSQTIFDEPRDVKGTALLSFTHKEGPDDQWLYLPAFRRLKRIPASGKKIVWPEASAKLTVEGDKIVRMEPYAGAAGLSAFLAALGLEPPPR